MTKDNERPTAQEYLNQMKGLKSQMFRLDMVVTTRLYTLCSLYPHAPVTVLIDENHVETVTIEAKSFIPKSRSKDLIKSIAFETRIRYIETIEKWLADQHPHKQLNIAFMEKFQVLINPETPVGERVVFVNDKVYVKGENHKS